MGHTFSSLKTKTTKLPIYAFGNLPGFLHSKRQRAQPLILWGKILIVWLARKKKNEKTKIYKKNRASSLYFTSFPKLYKGLIYENKLPGYTLRTNSRDIYYDRYMFDIFCKGNYKLFIRGYFTLLFLLKD